MFGSMTVDSYFICQLFRGIENLAVPQEHALAQVNDQR